MKNDDWTLKGKSFKMVYWDFNNEPDDDGYTKQETDNAFKSEDIEILRKKLIEDISKLSGKYGIEYISDVIIEIIDKRFGV